MQEVKPTTDDAQRKPTDWHEKPPADVRSVADALNSAERLRVDLPHIIQVYARDWDKVILADEIRRLQYEIAAATLRADIVGIDLQSLRKLREIEAEIMICELKNA